MTEFIQDRIVPSVSHQEIDPLPTPDELQNLIARAVDVLGASDTATEWLHTPLNIFQGRAPMEMAQTHAGFHAVEQALGRIEHGVFF